MGNNSELIKKYKLEETIKRLQKINEYTFYDSGMVEDDQDPNAANGGDMGGGMPPVDGGQGADPMAGGDPNAMGGTPQDGDMGGGMPPMDDPSAMGGDPNMGADPMAGGDPNAMGGTPQDVDMNADMGGDIPPMGGEEGIEDIEMDTEQPGDEVVDVDELTQSQESTEFKVDHVDDKLNKVLKVIEKFTDAIEANDQKIEDLKKEFAKRNPTAEETLNLRSLASYPFSERPDEYWKKQQAEHPNYNVISNNDVSTADEQKEFEIKKSDVDNFSERDILKSLGESHIKLQDFVSF